MIKVVVEVLEKKKIYIYSLSKVIIYLVFFNTDSMCKIHVVADNFLNTYIITLIYVKQHIREYNSICMSKKNVTPISNVEDRKRFVMET